MSPEDAPREDAVDDNTQEALLMACVVNEDKSGHVEKDSVVEKTLENCEEGKHEERLPEQAAEANSQHAEEDEGLVEKAPNGNDGGREDAWSTLEKMPEDDSKNGEKKEVLAVKGFEDNNNDDENEQSSAKKSPAAKIEDEEKGEGLVKTAPKKHSESDEYGDELTDETPKDNSDGGDGNGDAFEKVPKDDAEDGEKDKGLAEEPPKESSEDGEVLKDLAEDLPKDVVEKGKDEEKLVNESLKENIKDCKMDNKLEEERPKEYSEKGKYDNEFAEEPLKDKGEEDKDDEESGEMRLTKSAEKSEEDEDVVNDAPKDDSQSGRDDEVLVEQAPEESSDDGKEDRNVGDKAPQGDNECDQNEEGLGEETPRNGNEEVDENNGVVNNAPEDIILRNEYDKGSGEEAPEDSSEDGKEEEKAVHFAPKDDIECGEADKGLMEEAPLDGSEESDENNDEVNNALEDDTHGCEATEPRVERGETGDDDYCASEVGSSHLSNVEDSFPGSAAEQSSGVPHAQARAGNSVACAEEQDDSTERSPDDGAVAATEASGESERLTGHSFAGGFETSEHSLTRALQKVMENEGATRIENDDCEEGEDDKDSGKIAVTDNAENIEENEDAVNNASKDDYESGGHEDGLAEEGPRDGSEEGDENNDEVNNALEDDSHGCEATEPRVERGEAGDDDCCASEVRSSYIVKVEDSPAGSDAEQSNGVPHAQARTSNSVACAEEHDDSTDRSPDDNVPTGTDACGVSERLRGYSFAGVFENSLTRAVEKAKENEGAAQIENDDCEKGEDDKDLGKMALTGNAKNSEENENVVNNAPKDDSESGGHEDGLAEESSRDGSEEGDENNDEVNNALKDNSHGCEATEPRVERGEAGDDDYCVSEVRSIHLFKVEDSPAGSDAEQSNGVPRAQARTGKSVACAEEHDDSTDRSPDDDVVVGTDASGESKRSLRSFFASAFENFEHPLTRALEKVKENEGATRIENDDCGEGEDGKDSRKMALTDNAENNKENEGAVNNAPKDDSVSGGHEDGLAKEALRDGSEEGDENNDEVNSALEDYTHGCEATEPRVAREEARDDDYCVSEVGSIHFSNVEDSPAGSAAEQSSGVPHAQAGTSKSVACAEEQDDSANRSPDDDVLAGTDASGASEHSRGSSFASVFETSEHSLTRALERVKENEGATRIEIDAREEGEDDEDSGKMAWTDNAQNSEEDDHAVENVSENSEDGENDKVVVEEAQQDGSEDGKEDKDLVSTTPKDDSERSQEDEDLAEEALQDDSEKGEEDKMVVDAASKDSRDGPDQERAAETVPKDHSDDDEKNDDVIEKAPSESRGDSEKGSGVVEKALSENSEEDEGNRRVAEDVSEDNTCEDKEDKDGIVEYVSKDHSEEFVKDDVVDDAPENSSIYSNKGESRISPQSVGKNDDFVDDMGICYSSNMENVAVIEEKEEKTHSGSNEEQSRSVEQVSTGEFLPETGLKEREEAVERSSEADASGTSEHPLSRMLKKFRRSLTHVFEQITDGEVPQGEESGAGSGTKRSLSDDTRTAKLRRTDTGAASSASAPSWNEAVLPVPTHQLSAPPFDAPASCVSLDFVLPDARDAAEDVAVEMSPEDAPREDAVDDNTQEALLMACVVNEGKSFEKDENVLEKTLDDSEKGEHDERSPEQAGEDSSQDAEEDEGLVEKVLNGNDGDREDVCNTCEKIPEDDSEDGESGEDLAEQPRMDNVEDGEKKEVLTVKAFEDNNNDDENEQSSAKKSLAAKIDDDEKGEGLVKTAPINHSERDEYDDELTDETPKDSCDGGDGNGDALEKVLNDDAEYSEKDEGLAEEPSKGSSEDDEDDAELAEAPPKEEGEDGEMLEDLAEDLPIDVAEKDKDEEGFVDESPKEYIKDSEVDNKLEEERRKKNSEKGQYDNEFVEEPSKDDGEEGENNEELAEEPSEDNMENEVDDEELAEEPSKDNSEGGKTDEDLSMRKVAVLEQREEKGRGRINVENSSGPSQPLTHSGTHVARAEERDGAANKSLEGDALGNVNASGKSERASGSESSASNMFRKFRRSLTQMLGKLKDGDDNAVQAVNIDADSSGTKRSSGDDDRTAKLRRTDAGASSSAFAPSLHVVDLCARTQHSSAPDCDSDNNAPRLSFECAAIGARTAAEDAADDAPAEDASQNGDGENFEGEALKDTSMDRENDQDMVDMAPKNNSVDAGNDKTKAFSKDDNDAAKDERVVGELVTDNGTQLIVQVFPASATSSCACNRRHRTKRPCFAPAVSPPAADSVQDAATAAVEAAHVIPAPVDSDNDHVADPSEERGKQRPSIATTDGDDDRSPRRFLRPTRPRKSLIRDLSPLKCVCKRRHRGKRSCYESRRSWIPDDNAPSATESDDLVSRSAHDISASSQLATPSRKRFSSGFDEHYVDPSCPVHSPYYARSDRQVSGTPQRARVDDGASVASEALSDATTELADVDYVHPSVADPTEGSAHTPPMAGRPHRHLFASPHHDQASSSGTSTLRGRLSSESTPLARRKKKVLSTPEKNKRSVSARIVTAHEKTQREPSSHRRRRRSMIRPFPLHLPLSEWKFLQLHAYLKDIGIKPASRKRVDLERQVDETLGISYAVSEELET